MPEQWLEDLWSDEPTYRVYVCRGVNCNQRGSKEVLQKFAEEVKERGLDNDVEVLATSCRDRCQHGPSIDIYPGPVCYANVTLHSATDIVVDHLSRGKTVDRLVFGR